MYGESWRRPWGMVAFAASLVACRELPPLSPGICGNAVVEEGEDCDRVTEPSPGPATACGDATDGARACRYVCTDGASCPLGWACRSDDICHHGTGRFDATAGSIAWLGDDWFAGEVDGDGATDVVGAAASELRVARGDGAGGLGEGVRRALPIGTEAAPAGGDLDGDGRLDVVVPSPQGLVVLRGHDGTILEPASYSPFGVDGGDELAWAIPMRLFGLLPEHTVVALTAPGAEQQDLQFQVYSTRDIQRGGMSLLPGESLGKLHRPAVADLDGDGDDEMVLAFGGAEVIRVATSFRHTVAPHPTGLNPRSQELSLGLDPEPPFKPLQIAAAGADAPAADLLADVDGDGATDLLVRVQGERALVLHGDGRGGFGAPELDPRFDPGPALPAAPGWPLAAGDLDGVGPDDFVTETGLWVTDPDSGELVSTDPPVAGDRWREAAILDFDGDGAPDVAVADRDAPVLHLFLASPPAESHRFEPRPHRRKDVPTEGVATLLRPGDFDGDLAADLAFRAGEEGLVILFGESGWPGDPVRVATIDGLARVEVGALRYPPLAPLDPTTDIIASAGPDENGTQAAAIFVGAGSRVLDAPFALLDAFTPATPRAAVVGRFLPRAEGDATSDVLAIAGLLDQPWLWLVQDASEASFWKPGAARVARLERPDAECALWAAGDLDGDGQDELVGLRGRAGCAAAQEPALRVDVLSPGHVELTELAGAPLGPRALQLADLDGDGAADLLVAHATGVDLDWSDGTTLDLGHPTAVPASPEGMAPVAAVPIQADADPALELAVAAGGRVWLAEIEPGRAITLGAESIARLPATRLGAGDLDGDGLPELLVGDGVTLTPLRARSHLERP